MPAPPRVTMLAANDWRRDSRVVREAEALARDGYEVTVVFQRAVNAPEPVEHSNGVAYRCVALGDGSHEPYRPYLRIHLRVLALDTAVLGRAEMGPRRALAIASLLQPLLLAVLVPALALMRGLRARFPGIGEPVERFMDPLRYLNGYAVRSLAAVLDTRPDVIHAHDLITLSCGVLAGRHLRIPVVYDAHELETHTNYWSLSRLTNYCVEVYERALVANVRGIVTVSDSIADWLAREYGIPRPVVILNVPAAVSMASQAPALAGTAGRRSGGLRRTLGIGAQEPLAVYIGSITVDRGLEQCVAALAHWPELIFAMVGPRYDVVVERLEAIAVRLGVRDRLHFVDPVPAHEVVPFVSDADCSVIASQNVCLSYYFGMPNKLFESVLAGVPIAAPDLVETRRFVEENGVGLVMDETDPRSIAHTIREVVARRAEFEPHGMKLSRIIARYGWPVQERRLLDLYRALTAGRDA